MIRLSKSGYGVNFNQIFLNTNVAQRTINGITITRVSDNRLHLQGTADDIVPITLYSAGTPVGHKFHTYVSTNKVYSIYIGQTGVQSNEGIITANTNSAFVAYIANGTQINEDVSVEINDLTDAFGAGYEPTTVSQFREMYPDDYYDYTTGQWQWSKKGYETAYPTPVIENGTTLLPIENHIVGILSYDSGNIKTKYNYSTRELPVGYVRLDYIESTGTQWIDTGFKPNNKTRIIAKCLIPKYSEAFFGSKNVGQQLTFLAIAEGNYRWTYGSSVIWISTATTPIILDSNKNNLSLSGDNYTQNATANTETFDLDYTLYLFARHNNNETVSYGPGQRLFSCKIYDNGTLVRNYIPCYRYSDGVEGLYDTVGKQFYTNQGTGRFIRGNTLVDKSIIGNALRRQLATEQEIDYNKTAWIDLGTLNWSYNTTHNVFVSSSIADRKPSSSTKGLCEIYTQTFTDIPWSSKPDKSFQFYYGISTDIGIKDTRYSNATDFKKAMNNVLLAYEKA